MSSTGISIQRKSIEYDTIIFEDTHQYCLKPLKNGKPCPAYNNNYACPPFSPNYLRTQEKLRHFESFLLILFRYDLTYRRDYLRKKHPEWNEDQIETNALNPHLYNSVIYWGLRKLLVPYVKSSNTYVLGNSNCRLCNKCARKTGEPCRHPKQRIYSMEAAGINVDRTLRNIGVILEWPPVTGVYQIGLVCFRKVMPLSIAQQEKVKDFYSLNIIEREMIMAKELLY